MTTEYSKIEIEALSSEVGNEGDQIDKLYCGDIRVREILTAQWYSTYSNSHMNFLFGKLRAMNIRPDKEELINYLREESAKIHYVMTMSRNAARDINKIMTLNLAPPAQVIEDLTTAENRILAQAISVSRKRLEELLSNEKLGELK